MNNLSEKISASLLLGSYFETIGFNNSNWEFNLNVEVKNDLAKISFISHEMYFQFLKSGGKNFNIKKLNSSDDTLLMIFTAKATLKGNNINEYIKEYTKKLKLLEDQKRFSEITTVNSLRQIKKSSKKYLNYDDSMTGNGAAVRTSSIGLYFYKENQLELLIEKSIESSRITHNHTIGFLGGLVTALFTSYAVRNISPWKWADNLLKVYESNKIDNYLKKTDIYDKYLSDKKDFWDKWYEYREKEIPFIKDKNMEPFYIKTKKFIKYSYHIHPKKIDYSKLGSSGICSTIYAYDSLLNSIKNENKFNTTSLLVFSSIHTGDNDSTGMIAGCWFGALKGFYDFDKKNLEELEFYKEINDISKKFIKKLK